MVYLDYAATTPLDENVLKAMTPYLTEYFGNASSQHGYGRAAANAVVDARDLLAQKIGCLSEELFFTAGGTEADNWAVKCVCEANIARGKHIVVTSIEHPAVIESVKKLCKHGFEATFVSPDKSGIVSPQSIKEALREDTVLCAVMHANNETGVIQPIEEISKIVHGNGTFFFCDCVQTAGYLPLPVKFADALSVSAHKFYGPKGVGLLYLKKGKAIDRFMNGGHQERGLRGGTVNVAGIVGLAEAYSAAYDNLEKNGKIIKSLRDCFESKIKAQIQDVTVIGESVPRLPCHSNLLIKGCEGDRTVMSLDNIGIAASTGSACASGAVKISPVITSMGFPDEEAKCAVRFTFGKYTAENDITYTVDKLTQIAQITRKYNSLMQKN